MYMRFSVLVSKVLAYNFVDLFDIKLIYLMYAVAICKCITTAVFLVLCKKLMKNYVRLSE